MYGNISELATIRAIHMSVTERLDGDEQRFSDVGMSRCVSQICEYGLVPIIIRFVRYGFHLGYPRYLYATAALVGPASVIISNRVKPASPHQSRKFAPV